MTKTWHLTLPLTEEAVRALNVGDQVVLSGDIVTTIGMPTHQRLLDCLDAGEPLPVDFKGGAFFHLSSYNRENPATASGYEALYMNPSTSTRYYETMPRIIRSFGLRLVGGKGGLDMECVRALQEAGCAYLSFLGGGCTLHTQAITEVVSVHWTDYISQFRLVTLRVAGLEGTVAIDANGNSAYEMLRLSAQERMPQIMQELNQERAPSGQ